MPLLNRMRQLVSQQMPSAIAAGRILTGREVDIAPDGERVGAQLPAHARRAPVGVDPDSAEIRAETAFHERLRLAVHVSAVVYGWGGVGSAQRRTGVGHAH